MLLGKSATFPLFNLSVCFYCEKSKILICFNSTEPPFDRHDWFVQREIGGKKKEIRYVIDYYAGPDEPTGEPVFFLDVRPAVTPTQAVERVMRYGGDVWYRASGGPIRDQASN